MRFLRSSGHLAQAARIEAALEAAAGRLSEDKDDDVDPTCFFNTSDAYLASSDGLPPITCSPQRNLRSPAPHRAGLLYFAAPQLMKRAKVLFG